MDVISFKTGPDKLARGPFAWVKRSNIFSFIYGSGTINKPFKLKADVMII